jgi:hypothetical protein
MAHCLRNPQQTRDSFAIPQEEEYKDMHVWGCYILVPAHDLNNSEESVSDRKFYGFAKTRSLLLWLGLITDNVKHAHGARFLGI